MRREAEHFLLPGAPHGTDLATQLESLSQPLTRAEVCLIHDEHYTHMTFGHQLGQCIVSICMILPSRPVAQLPLS